MKVEDKREEQMTPFGELCIGDVFEFELEFEHEVVCIKIGSTLGLNTYTNDIVEFELEWYVKKLNAKIVIE